MAGTNQFQVMIFDKIAIEEDKNIDEKRLCKKCNKEEATQAISPCGHCLCESCAVGLQICPACNSKVNYFLKLYKS